MSWDRAEFKILLVFHGSFNAGKIFPKSFPSHPIQPLVNVSAEAGVWVCARQG